MNRIIICGYPKSGNTWLTKLVAELVGCPVTGFWKGDQYTNEIAKNTNGTAKEAFERKSEYRCYKSHHQLSELNPDVDEWDRIIYVVRDPRDVTISGSHYFTLNIFPFKKYVMKLPYPYILLKIMRKVFGNDREKNRIKHMLKAILYGDRKVHSFCRISWITHLRPFIDAGILHIKYESMLENPYAECQKILAYIGLKRDREFIEKSIKKHSFEFQKKTALENGNKKLYRFLRQGKKEQWKNKLSEKQKQTILKEIGNEMAEFGYLHDSS